MFNRKLGRRASASIEFALISTLFLLPLFGSSADMIVYISAKAQLNTALQALYYFGLSYNPGSTARTLTDPTATLTQANANKVVTLMSSTFHPMTLTSFSISYDCISTSATTVTYTPTSPANTNNGCTSSQTQRTRVSYTVTSSIFLPIPNPFAGSNPLTLTESGTVQIY